MVNKNRRIGNFFGKLNQSKKLSGGGGEAPPHFWG